MENRKVCMYLQKWYPQSDKIIHKARNKQDWKCRCWKRHFILYLLICSNIFLVHTYLFVGTVLFSILHRLVSYENSFIDNTRYNWARIGIRPLDSRKINPLISLLPLFTPWLKNCMTCTRVSTKGFRISGNPRIPEISEVRVRTGRVWSI